MEKKEKCCTKTASKGGCNEKKTETMCQDEKQCKDEKKCQDEKQCKDDKKCQDEKQCKDDKKCQDEKKKGKNCHTKSRPTGDPMEGDVC
ncbi:MAG: hypothetical protein K2L56_03290 [Prevotella sp.]|nr:hypothetical protein [Prevotella sp.]